MAQGFRLRARTCVETALGGSGGLRHRRSAAHGGGIVVIWAEHGQSWRKAVGLGTSRVMRDFDDRTCARGVSFLLILWCWLATAAIADPQGTCDGTEVKGAWFTALAPSGMATTASRVSPGDGGALSVWLRSDDGSTEFYVFSPQWGGTPYEIFLGARSKREVVAVESQTLRSVQLELVYADAIGRYSMTQSSDPVSHLTVGYRTQTGTLTKEYLQKYNCFVNSINQYAD